MPLLCWQADCAAGIPLWKSRNNTNQTPNLLTACLQYVCGVIVPVIHSNAASFVCARRLRAAAKTTKDIIPLPEETAEANATSPAPANETAAAAPAKSSATSSSYSLLVTVAVAVLGALLAL